MHPSLLPVLSLAGLPLPAGHPWNPQVHGGGQGGAGAKCHPKGTTGASHCLRLCRPGIPSSHTLRGNIHPHRMQEELDTRLLPEAEESGRTYRESVHLQHSVCAGIFTPTRGAQGTLLPSPTTPRSAIIISRYQRGGWSAERLIELSNTRGKQQQTCFSLALQPVSRCGGGRGGTHLQSPREHSPSSLPRCLQGLSYVKMEHPRAVTAHGGQGGQKVSCRELM